MRGRNLIEFIKGEVLWERYLAADLMSSVIESFQLQNNTVGSLIDTILLLGVDLSLASLTPVLISVLQELRLEEVLESFIQRPRFVDILVTRDYQTERDHRLVAARHVLAS